MKRGGWGVFIFYFKTGYVQAVRAHISLAACHKIQHFLCFSITILHQGYCQGTASSSLISSFYFPSSYFPVSFPFPLVPTLLFPYHSQ